MKPKGSLLEICSKKIVWKTVWIIKACCKPKLFLLICSGKRRILIVEANGIGSEID